MSELQQVSSAGWLSSFGCNLRFQSNMCHSLKNRNPLWNGVSFRQKTIAGLLAAMLSSCHPSQYHSAEVIPSDVVTSRKGALFPWSCPSYEGGDGSTLDRAVVLTGISVSFMGGKAKEGWLKHHYPRSIIREVHKQIVRSRIFEVV